MNNLKNTDLGGYPFVLDDLRFESQAVRDALKGTLNQLGGRRPDGSDAIFMLPIKNTSEVVFPPINDPATDTIINASNNWTTPDMWVFLNGEYWFLPSQILTSTVPTFSHYKLQKNIGFTGTTPGLKTFQSGASNETYEVRTVSLVLQNGGVPAGDPYALIGSSGSWVWNTNWTYQNLLKSVVGFRDLNNAVNSNTAASTANQTAIANQQNELNTLTAPWQSLTVAQMQGMVKQGEFQSSGDVDPLQFWGGANLSWFNFKVSGSTVFVNMNLVAIDFQAFQNKPSKSLILEGLGALLGVPGQIVDFFDYGQSVCTETDGGSGPPNNVPATTLHMGRAEITKRFGSGSDLAISKSNEQNGLFYTYFNRQYVYQADHRTLDVIGVIDFVPRWNFKASFTIQFA